MSMTIEYLSKCKGASKFGNCVNCGVSSGDSKDLTWISFVPNNGGYHTTICFAVSVDSCLQAKYYQMQ